MASLTLRFKGSSWICSLFAGKKHLHHKKCRFQSSNIRNLFQWCGIFDVGFSSITLNTVRRTYTTLQWNPGRCLVEIRYGSMGTPQMEALNCLEVVIEKETVASVTASKGEGLLVKTKQIRCTLHNCSSMILEMFSQSDTIQLDGIIQFSMYM